MHSFCERFDPQPLHLAVGNESKHGLRPEDKNTVGRALEKIAQPCLSGEPEPGRGGNQVVPPTLKDLIGRFCLSASPLALTDEQGICSIVG
jgi:hypothetical protein